MADSKTTYSKADQKDQALILLGRAATKAGVKHADLGLMKLGKDLTELADQTTPPPKTSKPIACGVEVTPDGREEEK